MCARLLVALGIVVLQLRAQQDPEDLLKLVRSQVARSLDRIPRYMCTQTIDRTLYAVEPGLGAVCDPGRDRPSTHVDTSDRLRLDVAMTSTGEMYSWVGESKFNDHDLLDIVHDGSVSTGSFAGFLAAIFSGDSATFTYNGETTQDGRPVSEFGFRVPREKSHFVYGRAPHRVITAYDGVFWVDPKTADLIRLVIRTSRLPSETAACYATHTLDYNRTRLKGNDFLLPSAASLRIFYPDGTESQNRAVFSNCHEFLGESKIEFNSPVESSDRPNAQTSKALAIPPGLSFKVSLDQGVDTSIAAAGDPLKGKLVTPLRRGSEILVPKGTSVAARIVRVRQFYGDNPGVLLEVKLEALELGGVLMPFTAKPTGSRIFQKTAGTLKSRIELGTLQQLEDRAATFEFRNVRQPYLIRSGLESTWVTTAPSSGNLVTAPPE
jgi:hypothetical protein